VNPKHKGDGKVIYVGPRCVVCVSEFTMVAGNSQKPFLQEGRILLQKSSPDEQLQVEIRESPSYAFGSLRKGARGDTTPLVDEFGNPAPEVQLLKALLSDRVIDQFEALPNFIAQRKAIASKVLDRLSKVVPAYEAENLNALAMMQDENTSGDSYPAILDLEPEMFRHFVGQWMSIMVEENRMKQIKAWENAAQRMIQFPAALHRRIRSSDQIENRASDEDPLIVAAIKHAALEDAGLPNQASIRKVLNKGGKTRFDTNSVKSKLKKLGFGWIPTEPEWKKFWLPFSPDGWK
jgi:hypothetical protein